ncbi:protein argonaute-2-like isoform X1 [Bombus pascuorum]|uniref:protein argonaute-2-like isoform X1 n=1 Tax=Bombus pascuorum TaxID=65598 RepID=UPI00298ECED6|nr:protein argonaute-2-like isoform X1 [Bombus pascuorum]
MPRKSKRRQKKAKLIDAQQETTDTQQETTDTEEQGPIDTEEQGPIDTQQQGPSGTSHKRSSGKPQQEPSGKPQQGPNDGQQQGPSGIPQQRPSARQQQGPSARQQQMPIGTPQPGPSGTPQPGPSGIQKQQKSEHVERKQAPVLKQVSEQVQQPTGTVSKSKVFPKHLQQIYLNQMPIKNSVGTMGRKIMVETNMFRLIFPSNFETRVIHYDVVITPDKPKCFLRKVFEEFRKVQCPKRYPAFDGRKNAYSANDLPFGDQSKEEELTILDKELQKQRTFKIYLKKVAVLDLSWIKNLKYDAFESDTKQQCIQALDIILRHGPASQYITVGRSLFQPPEPGRVISLTNGLNLWFGVFQSAIVGSRAYLNVDVAHKGFPKEQSVIDLMKELCQNPRGGPVPEHLTARDIRYNQDKIEKFLKGLKVHYELQGQPTSKRIYPVNGLVDSARGSKFIVKDGTVTTVEEYFLQTKKYKIKYPDLPCLWVGSKNSKIYVPAELCTVIAGQVLRKKLDEAQTAKMIRETATSADTRKQKILSSFANMKLNDQPSLLNEFHFSVHGQFEKVPARVLEAPKLQYNARQVNVFKGTWRADKFLIPCNLPENSWTMLNLNANVRDTDLHMLHDRLRQFGSSLNMTINRALTPFTMLTLKHNISNIIAYFEEKKQQDIKLVLVILPNVDSSAYSVVKQISELKIPGGIVTQCIKHQTLRKLNDSTVGNILLKINSKLNGVNHTFVLSYCPPCLREPCMIVGADVTHPSPDASTIPSIAAVAASHDLYAFQYNVEIRLQPPREEMIRDMEEIMIIQLKYFYAKTGHKPKRIIVYRDGVSDGQLLFVMHYELEAIKRAINRLNRNQERDIAITFFVVQKRHHIRLFPTDKRNSDDRNFNVQAGTIVDTEITHPTYIDFYLVSHASIQGTARPTKYRCVCNESHMREDEIEQLTYYLCHMFARCTRSVSYPAPTYYAHLAAFRARALIHNVNVDVERLAEEQRKKMTLQINKSSPMFFV